MQASERLFPPRASRRSPLLVFTPRTSRVSPPTPATSPPSRPPPFLVAGAIALTLSGCGTAPRQAEPRVERPARQPELQVERAPRVAKAPGIAPTTAPPSAPPPAPRTLRGGGYYLDDGPGDSPPVDLDSIPEPVPQLEPLHRGAMRPYVVLGQSFTPMTELQPYKAQGIATWYGRRYHGKQTSNGEIYDMYGISAAHPTLPIPSYARVTHVATGRSVVVRINDRGPFIDNRLIDLSYTAAHRLGVIGGGSALVEVESIFPEGPLAGTAVANVPPRARVATVQPASAAAAPRSSLVAADADEDPIAVIAASGRYLQVAPAMPARDARTISTPRETPLDLTGVYLQLGAFASRENAESYLARAKVQFEWLAERLQVRIREGLFRVHAGPYATPGEAKQAGERIAASLGTKPVLITR